MGKIIYVMMTLIVLNLSFLVFNCTDSTCSESLVSPGSSTNDTLWTIIANPVGISTNTGFWGTLFGSGWGLLGAIGAAVGAILIGTTFFSKDTTGMVYIALGLALTASLFPAVKLFQLINGLSIGDSITRTILSILISGTIVLVAIFTVLDWARGKE